MHLVPWGETPIWGETPTPCIRETIEHKFGPAFSSVCLHSYVARNGVKSFPSTSQLPKVRVESFSTVFLLKRH